VEAPLLKHLRGRADAPAEVRVRLLSLLGFASFALVSLWVGGRLLGLALRTRHAPEAAVGTALFCGGGLGYVLAIGSRMDLLPADWAGDVRLAGAAFIHLGSAALAVGCWRIFRPSERWACALCLAIVGALATSFALRLSDPPGAGLSNPLHFWPMQGLGAATFGWCAFESARYAALLRRRVRLGLAEPEMQERFVLWATSASCAVGVHLCVMANRFSDPIVVSPALVITTSALGFVTAVTVWLAFFPPTWWPSRAVLRRS
jgi:hypothetical protein